MAQDQRGGAAFVMAQKACMSEPQMPTLSTLIRTSPADGGSGSGTSRKAKRFGAWYRQAPSFRGEPPVDHQDTWPVT
jgi:hypothetical protein